MRTVRTVGDLRAALAGSRRAGRTIGLVPTMGSFHEGHLSLMRQAREECDEVVVSLFVNPTQFDQAAALSRYPTPRELNTARAFLVNNPDTIYVMEDMFWALLNSQEFLFNH